MIFCDQKLLTVKDRPIQGVLIASIRGIYICGIFKAPAFGELRESVVIESRITKQRKLMCT
jgi:hypothetical protein